MWRLIKFLGILVSWVLPIAVLYYNHVVDVGATQELDMFGLIFILVIVLSIVKAVDKRISVWDIQRRNKLFIMCWQNAKKILTAVFFTWILVSIEDDLPKMQLTAGIITGCFIVGFLLSLLGEFLKHRKKKQDIDLIS